jgi:hypothetical protein
MKKSIITDFSGFENDELDEKGDTIDEQLTDNTADFPDLPVVIADYHNHLVTFSTILGKAIYPEKTADLNVAKKVLLKDLRRNGVYINELADGDEVLLAKCGYPYAKEPAPVGPLGKGGFKKVESIIGGFEIEVNVLEHAKGHMLCLIPTIDLINGGRPVANKPGKWPWYHSSNTKFRITDLDPSTKYTLITCGVGTDKTLTFSDPIERTTQ